MEGVTGVVTWDALPGLSDGAAPAWATLDVRLARRDDVLSGHDVLPRLFVGFGDVAASWDSLAAVWGGLGDSAASGTLRHCTALVLRLDLGLCIEV